MRPAGGVAEAQHVPPARRSIPDESARGLHAVGDIEYVRSGTGGGGARPGVEQVPGLGAGEGAGIGKVGLLLELRERGRRDADRCAAGRERQLAHLGVARRLRMVRIPGVGDDQAEARGAHLREADDSLALFLEREGRHLPRRFALEDLQASALRSVGVATADDQPVRLDRAIEAQLQPLRALQGGSLTWFVAAAHPEGVRLAVECVRGRMIRLAGAGGSAARQRFGCGHGHDGDIPIEHEVGLGRGEAHLDAGAAGDRGRAEGHALRGLLDRHGGAAEVPAALDVEAQLEIEARGLRHRVRKKFSPLG